MEPELLNDDLVKCQGCKNNEPSIEPHTCPFKEDINDDHESLCRCCDDCTHECAMDI